VIAAEKLDENGLACRRFVLPRDAKASAKRKRPIADGSHHDVIDTDVEDETYVGLVSKGGGDDDSSDSSDDDIEIQNDEV
jgi:hypothetical protein